MIRTSQHILKYQTSKKTDFLESLFFSYEISLRKYLEKILNGDISLKKFMSSKDLPNCEIYHSQWKQLVYKQASQIVRSQTKLAYKRREKKYKYIYSTLKRREEKGNKLCKIYRDFLEKHYHDLYLKDILKSKYFYIPTLKNLTIEVESKLFDLKESKKYFNCWLNLRLPFFYSDKKRAIAIGTNETGWPGLNQTEIFSKRSLGQGNQFMTKVSNRPFCFLSCETQSICVSPKTMQFVLRDQQKSISEFEPLTSNQLTFWKS